jgi:manganese/zinc/iron transport system permease protein
MNVETLLNALTLQAGYNASVVSVGALLLGIAAGGVGTFVLFRKRALVSDAVSHATLPGVGLAFLVMTAMGGDGRSLPGLLAGAALTAALGLVTVSWIVRRSRLGDDAAIGAVLSVFFGVGIVILTIIQTMNAGRQAGLGGFLLGATAGMLLEEALFVAVAAAVSVAALIVLRRPLTLIGFDPDYATAAGYRTDRYDLLLSLLALAVVVIGLKVVGLVLVVALMIIPPVTARFWTDRAGRMVVIAAGLGALSGFVGTALSAAADNLPTGPVIVLVSFALFIASLLVAPVRGILAAALTHRAFERRVHERQGLLALARGDTIFDRLTLRVLIQKGFIRPDGVPTTAGRGAAALALRDEARWDVFRRLTPSDAVMGRYDGLTPISDVLTPDQIAGLDRHLVPRAVTGAP